MAQPRLRHRRALWQGAGRGANQQRATEGEQPILGAIADSLGPRSVVVIGGLGALAAAAFGLVACRRAVGTPTRHDNDRPGLVEGDLPAA